MNKICPLRSAAYGCEMFCEEEACALWKRSLARNWMVSPEGVCALLEISSSLKIIAQRLRGLER